MKMILKCLNVHDDRDVKISIMEHACYIYVRPYENCMALFLVPLLLFWCGSYVPWDEKEKDILWSA